MFNPSKISLDVMVLMTTGFSKMSVAQSSGLAEVTITGSNLKRSDKPAPYYPGSNTSTTVQQGYSSGLYNNTGRYTRFTAKYTF